MNLGVFALLCRCADSNSSYRSQFQLNEINCTYCSTTPKMLFRKKESQSMETTNYRHSVANSNAFLEQSAGTFSNCGMIKEWKIIAPWESDEQ